MRLPSKASALILGALIVGSSGCSDRPETSDSILIGMLAPMTGPGARFGQSQHNGVLLALEQLNLQGGIGGRRLELILEDTKTEPPTAVTAFTHLAERGDLLALFGSAASLDVPAYLPQVDRAQIPHLLPVAVLPSITRMGSHWTFRSALNDSIAATAMAEYAVRVLGARHVALLIEDSAFGKTGLGFGARGQELGVAPLAVEYFKRGDIDMKPQLTKIRSLGATHLVFWGYYAEYALVAKQIRELGMSVDLLGNQAPVNDKTIELAGTALEGARNICLFVSTDPAPAARKFVSEYQARFGELPDTWAAQSYDGMELLASAIRTGGPARDRVRDALAATRGFQGLTGTISFAPNGDAAFLGTHIVRVSNGKFVPDTGLPSHPAP